MLEKKWLIPAGIGAVILGLAFVPSIEQTVEKEIILPLKYHAIQQWMPYIRQIATQYGIDPNFVAAEMYQESGGNQNAVSSTGALGLLQIEPSTGISECGFTSAQLLDPYNNITCAIKYMTKAYNQFKDYRFVAAGYYGGIGTSPDSLKGNPTVASYVQSVMNHYNNISMVA